MIKSLVFFSILILGSIVFAEDSITEQTNSFRGITINVAMTKRADVDSFFPMIEKFTKLTGIKVEVSQDSYFVFFKKLKLEHKAKLGKIDIFYLSPGHIGFLSQEDYLFPIDNLMKKYNVDFKDFPTADYFVKYPGRRDTLGFPYSSITQLNLYRTDWFENPEEQKNFKQKYGYDLLPPRTMQQFMDVAEFFTRDTDGNGEIDQYGWARSHGNRSATYKNVLWYIWSFGGEIYDEETYQVLLDTPGNAEAFRFAKKLSNYAPPIAFSDWGANEQTGYYDKMGNIAMVQNWTNYMIKALDPKQSRLANVSWVAPQPGKFIVGGGALAISNQSKNTEAAFLFLKWLTSRENAVEWFLHGAPIARQSTHESKQLKSLKPELSDFFAVNLEGEKLTTRSRPTIPVASDLEPILYKAWFDFMDGKKTEEEALKEAHQSIELLFKKNGYIK
ncbi:MAG: extracellular solute-binding protein [Spirochaetaceae bacterium]